MAEITLRYPALLLLLPLVGLLWATLAWRRRFRPLGPLLLRLAIVALVILALARPVRQAPLPTADPQDGVRRVLLVDQSASLGAAGQAQLRARAETLTQGFPDSLTLFFGDRPVLVSDSLTDNREQPFDPEISNLAEALSMGARLLVGRPGRLVLLSDGLPTAGDVDEAVTGLVRAGIPVDVVPPDGPLGPNEIRLVELGVPPSVRQGETFGVEIVLYSDVAAGVALSLFQDQTPLAQDDVGLEPGLNRFTFEVTAEEIGPHTFRAEVTSAPGEDGQPLNNRLSAFAQVHAPPQILVVGEEPAARARFSRHLREAGFAPRWAGPAQVPDRLSELEAYAGMALLDVSARELALEQMVAVQEFVRSLGRGLLVAGGRESFSLGHYEDTPLADLLPVSLEPPPREERPPVALLLVIDHSGSMGTGGEPSKLAMAQEAAIRATEVLGPEDRIGVLVFDDEYEWIVPFQRVSEGAALLEIQGRIGSIPVGGGTLILDALQAGLVALAEQEVDSGARHAVLFTDGHSFDWPRTAENYDAAVADAVQDEITLSTIAIGAGADEAMLMRLAERGRGRYHLAAQPEELPALTIAESAILRSNALQEGEFRAAVSMPHPILRGLSLPGAGGAANAWPPLSGYIAVSPKPLAEVALQVGPGDPLLSAWGYGLGRVAAWTSDTGAEWAADWERWPEAERFWGQLVGYTLPAPDLGLLQLEVEVGHAGVVTLVAEGVTATGETVDLAPPQATLTTPAGRETSLALLQVAPGRYEQRLRLPDPGAYRLTVAQSRAGGPPETATTGFVVPYPAEYGLPDPGSGEALLRHIAEVTGGRLLASAAPAGPETTTPEPIAGREPRELWPWLLGAALILWPVEIAWRRWGRLRIQ